MDRRKTVKLSRMENCMATIYYVGYDTTHPDDFVYHVPEGLDSWLLLLTQTPAQFWVQGEFKEYPPHYAILYPPRQKILYRACANKYINDWVRFEANESFLPPVPLGVPFAVPDPGYLHQLFQLLTTETFFGSTYRDMSIDYLLRIMFNKLLETSRSTKESPHHQELLGLRKQIHNKPGYPWTVAAMAEALHLSPGYLQNLYKLTFGISCVDDVIQCRIRLSKEMLSYSPYRISEIADICGYRNVEHFCRQFRRITGQTPGSFRKSCASSPIPPESGQVPHG